MNRTENIEQIALHYGYEPQSRQLIEEMAELTVAINKLWRLDDNGDWTIFINRKAECEMNIIEEIADVEIMLEQIKLLLNCGAKVEMVKDVKVKRQLERMYGDR